MKSLLVLHSLHHHNVEKVAKEFAKALGAEIKAPQQIDLEALQAVDLIDVRSGIWGE
jgi:flavodoxin